MIAGFEQPDEGEIVIGGRDAVGVPPYRRDVNTVFQQYALFPHMSVLDNVAYGLKQRGAGRPERYAKARAALELVRMTGRERHRPSMLSGGQQQRVALAAQPALPRTGRRERGARRFSSATRGCLPARAEIDLEAFRDGFHAKRAVERMSTGPLLS